MPQDIKRGYTLLIYQIYLFTKRKNSFAVVCFRLILLKKICLLLPNGRDIFCDTRKSKRI